jgi:hypothetical protein
VRQMDEKIEPGLFARLMQLSAPARKDLLEYLGQGPVSAESLLNGSDFGRDSARPDCARSDASEPPR